MTPGQPEDRPGWPRTSPRTAPQDHPKDTPRPGPGHPQPGGAPGWGPEETPRTPSTSVGSRAPRGPGAGVFSYDFFLLLSLAFLRGELSPCQCKCGTRECANVECGMWNVEIIWGFWDPPPALGRPLGGIWHPTMPDRMPGCREGRRSAPHRRGLLAGSTRAPPGRRGKSLTYRTGPGGGGG